LDIRSKRGGGKFLGLGGEKKVGLWLLGELVSGLTGWKKGTPGWESLKEKGEHQGKLELSHFRVSCWRAKKEKEKIKQNDLGGGGEGEKT